MQAKPLRPVIDRKHPLARGLVGAWPMGWSTTGVERNLVSPGSYDLTPSNNPTRNVIPSGQGTKYVSASSQRHTSPGGLAYAPASFYLRFVFHATGVVCFGRWGSAGYNWILYEIAGGLRATINFQALSGMREAVSTMTLTAGTEYAVVGVWSGGATHHAFFSRPGFTEKITTLLTSTAGAGPSINSQVAVASNSDGGQYANITVSDVRLWNRTLTDDECLSMLAHPWALYRPARVRGAASLREAPIMPGRRGAYRLSKGA